MYDPKSDGKDRISRKIIAKTPGLVVPGVFLYEYKEKGIIRQRTLQMQVSRFPDPT